MGIKGDYIELVSSLKGDNILKKIISIMFFFGAVSSIASLSDHVFKWKGFILNGINGYHAYIVNPIISYGEILGFNYTENEIHNAVFLSIAVSLGMSLLANKQVIVFNEINKTYGGNTKPNLFLFHSIKVLFPVGVWISFGLTDSQPSTWLLILIVVFYPFCLAVPKILMGKLNLNKSEHKETNIIYYYKYYYLYFSLILFIVCILAAINSGISKTV